LEHRQPARVIRVRFRVQEHLDILDIEAEFRNAPHDHLRSRGIAGVVHDVAFEPGDEKGGNVGRPDVVQIARYAERFCRPLSADLVRVQPPGDKKQRERDHQSQPGEHASPGEAPHPSPSTFANVKFHNPCMILVRAARILSVP
jgi:hypothetical protein